MLPKFLATHVTAGAAALLCGLTRRRVTQLCEDGRAPGSFFVSDGRGRGFWCVQLDSSGTPLLDRGEHGGFRRRAPFEGWHQPAMCNGGHGCAGPDCACPCHHTASTPPSTVLPAS